MFEQSIDTFLLQVVMRYGTEGREILTEFRNKDILDTINSMSEETLKLFSYKIDENLSKTKIFLDWFIRNDYLVKEERFDYDTFYHNCYQRISNLLNDKKSADARYEVLKYQRIIENIRANIKTASDIKGVFTTTYQVKDELKLTEAQKIYQFKKYIENYFKKLVKDCGFDVNVSIITEDILMLVDYILNGLGCEDILSKLSFVNGEESLLATLKNYEDEFKEILGNLAFDKNNNFAILTNKFEREELDIYLFVLEGLEKTKKVNETNLIDSIFNNPSLQKKNPNLIEE